jgi:hypothetical protein
MRGCCGVEVAVGVGVGVLVGTGVGVAVGIGVAVEVAVGVLVGSGVGVSVGVAVLVDTETATGSGVVVGFDVDSTAWLLLPQAVTRNSPSINISHFVMVWNVSEPITTDSPIARHILQAVLLSNVAQLLLQPEQAHLVK